MKKGFVLLVVLTLFIANICRSSDFWGPSPEDEPSVLSYGISGFSIGTIVGVSAGYLNVVDDDDADFGDFLLGPLYGALIGTGVGLTIGIIDSNRGETGIGGIVLRDIWLGSLLGLGVGAAAGGIKAIDSSDWEDVGKGAAWGSLIGAGGGLIFGLYEGPKVVEESQEETSLYKLRFYCEKGKNGIIISRQF